MDFALSYIQRGAGTGFKRLFWGSLLFAVLCGAGVYVAVRVVGAQPEMVRLMEQMPAIQIRQGKLTEPAQPLTLAIPDTGWVVAFNAEPENAAQNGLYLTSDAIVFQQDGARVRRPLPDKDILIPPERMRGYWQKAPIVAGVFVGAQVWINILVLYAAGLILLTLVLAALNRAVQRPVIGRAVVVGTACVVALNLALLLTGVGPLSLPMSILCLLVVGLFGAARG
ncbi:MAG: hypothetical protein PHX68_02470 [Alphaproteobacteria bacterium]|nr:hypothetical protein [Alphaproteobacteria bacterium]